MGGYIQIVTTIDSKEKAKEIATLLVEKKLAACVQVIGPVYSVYKWKGEVENANEWICNIKTEERLYREVERAIKDAHTYEVPEIVFFSITGGSGDYLSWISNETGR
jgi:periplasmic divalent cation tolerance protein